MLDRLSGKVHDTKHGSPALRLYLWWGLLVRSVLLFAMLTLLIARGNFLAEWLLTLQLPLIPQAEVEKLGIISYAALFLLLSAGSVARWGLLQRLEVTRPTPEDESTESTSRSDKSDSHQEQNEGEA